MNPKNMVSGEVTAENKARVLALVVEISTLLPPLISLSKGSARRWPASVMTCWWAAWALRMRRKSFRGLCRPLCDPAEMRRDNAVASSMKEIEAS